MHYQINYREDEQGNIMEIRAELVEADHVGTEQTFRGDTAVEQVRAGVMNRH